MRRELLCVADVRTEKLAQLRTEADANLERAEKAESAAKVRWRNAHDVYSRVHATGPRAMYVL